MRVTVYAASRYLHSIQDTGDMLCRWAISLQSYDFTVKYKPGKLHIVPDTLPRLFAFERHDEMTFKLVSTCRNIPDDPALQTAVPTRPYRVSAEELNDVQPVQSDRDLFHVKSVYSSVTNVYESVDHGNIT